MKLTSVLCEKAKSGDVQKVSGWRDNHKRGFCFTVVYLLSFFICSLTWIHQECFISSVDFRVKTSCSAVLPCHFKAPSKKHFITYNGLCWREENLFLFYSLSRDLHFSCSRLCAHWAHAEIGCHFFRQWFLGNPVTALIQTSTQCGGYKTQVPMEWPAVWR